MSEENHEMESEAVKRKRIKDLRYYYNHRDRILAAQMEKRQNDPAFQERQRLKEEEKKAKEDAKRASQEAREREKEEKKALSHLERQKRQEAKVRTRAQALGAFVPPAEV